MPGGLWKLTLNIWLYATRSKNLIGFPQTSSAGQPGFPTGSEFWAPQNFA